MPIEVFCQSCQRKMRVPDTAAGKRIRCPKCQGVISVPGGEAPAAAAPAIPTPSKLAAAKSSPAIPQPRFAGGSKIAAKAAPKPPAEQWYVQTEDGQQFGPVSRTELDQWYSEGRITAETQLLLEGAAQWQWASEIYPDLEGAAPAEEAPAFAAPSAGGVPDFGALAAESPSAGGSGPFDFGTAATPSSVSARVGGKKSSGRGKSSRGGSKGGSPHIDYIAITNYILGGLEIFAGILMMVAGGSIAATMSGSGDDAAAGGIMGTIFFVMGLVFILVSIPLMAAGYGLQQRASWGRLLTLIIAGLSALTFSPLNIAFAIWVFVVLLDKDNAAAFR